jgi:hypothetical protein
MRAKLRITLSAIAVLVASASQANAAIVDFTGVQTGQNYSQNGMQVTTSPLGGLQTHWGEVGHIDPFGSGLEAIHTLISGGDFTLNSVDMPSVGIFPGSETGRFTAYNNGVSLGFVDLAAGIGTYNFGALFANIDEFRVGSPDTHISWDNVNFTASNSVPVGSSAVLVGLALLGLAAVRSRVIKQA